jgi:hypothetical protein
MPGYFRAAAIVMTAGAIAGAGVLAMLPSAPIDPRDDARPPLFAILEGADRPQVPCKQQLWVNSDRGCQTWTVPHRDVERALSEKTDAIGESAPTNNPGATEWAPAEITDVPMSAPKSESPPVPAVVAERDQVMPQIKAQRDEPPSDRAAESVAAAEAQVVGGETVAEVRTRASSVPDDRAKVARRGADASRSIPIASRSADGTRRVIMIRPTSRQDVLYYSAIRLPKYPQSD